MSAFATLPPDERALFFQQYQQLHGVDPVIVEKDFWVCWLLGRIFSRPELGDEAVFKGGTSLSKVFGAIARFSEDVDLGISPAALGWSETELESGSKRTWRERLRPKLEADCASHVADHWRPVLEAEICKFLGAAPQGGFWMNYQLDEASRSPVLFFAYPGALPRGIAYISPEVKIEFGSLTDQRPTGRRRITALVAELAPAAFPDFGADVVALEVERTFWEKATILHAEYHRPADSHLRARFARHYADFAALWHHPSASEAPRRLDLLERVRNHKARFFASGWANYSSAVPGSLRLVPPDERLAELRRDYEAMRPMFLDEPLSFDEMLAVLREAEQSINRL
ncbi:MAG: nucleotidyl transferase AbiEii/AbiGii toxin family protein [Burkholderiales bacterium]|jgi:hypothetical protein